VKKKPGFFIVYIIMFAVLLWFDRLTKNIVMTHMYIGEALPSQDSFFAIRYTINTGVSFSMLEGHREVLIVLQFILIVVVTAALIITYIRLRHSALQTGLCWIVVGGAGNLIDRLTLGYVVDFISVGTFPVWNFADMCVVGGVIVLAVYLLFLHPKSEPETTVSDGSEKDPFSNDE